MTEHNVDQATWGLATLGLIGVLLLLAWESGGAAMKSPRIVRNMVLVIDHDLGKYGLVTQANRQQVDVVTERGIELPYAPSDARQLPVLGSLRRGKAYSSTTGRRFQRVEFHHIDGRPPLWYDIVTRADRHDSEETRAAVIYRLALQRIAEATT